MPELSRAAVHNALRRFGGAEGPPTVVTMTLDLRPADTQSRRPAEVFAEHARDAARDDGEAEDRLRALEPWLLERVEGAIADGAQGLLLAADAGAGRSYELPTPRPFRNSVQIGPRPWLFEVGRYLDLHGRPVTAAVVNLHTAQLLRVQFGLLEETGRVDTNPQFVAGHGRRDSLHNRGGPVDATVGHSYSRVERSVLAHRYAFGSEERDAFLTMLQRGDIVCVIGQDEARAQLLNRLPDDVRGRAVERSVPTDAVEHPESLTATLDALAVEAQQDENNNLVRRRLGGEDADRTMFGVEAVRRALEEGRVETLLLHEHAGRHRGDAWDARVQPGLLDDDTLNDLLWAAAEVDATVRTATVEELAERHAGVGATLRW